MTQWHIELDPAAARALRALDPPIARRVLSFLRDLSKNNMPRSTGRPMAGSTFHGMWRYRVGDWRILCEIEEESMTIFVADIGHRSKIYRHR